MKNKFFLTFIIFALLSICLTVSAADAELYGDNLYYYVEGEAVVISGYAGTPEEIVIPDAVNGVPVTSIAASAFNNCTSLKTIFLPDTITMIGKNAFNGCTSLENLYIEDLTSYLNIDYSRDYTACPMYFAKNLYINGILSENVTVPEGVTVIPIYAFYGCECLKSISLPSTLESISGSSFSGCINLQSVTFKEGVTNIGASSFYGCTSLKEIAIPDSVTSIGRSAFYLNTALKTVKLGKNLLTLGEYAFSDCSSLETVNIPSKVRSIPEYCFQRCSALKNLTIENGVQKIETRAFQNCKSLPSITIPDSVTTIKSYAFAWCESVTEIYLGTGLTAVQHWAFGCGDQLSDVYIDTLEAWLKINFVYSDSNIGSPMNQAENLYIGGVLAEEIVIPDGTTEIKSMQLFSIECLKKVTIPKSVTRIKQCAFGWSTSITDIEFKGTDIEWMKIEVGEKNQPIADVVPVIAENLSLQYLTYKANADNTEITITGFTGSPVELAIPGKINGIPVTTIAESAFSNCKSLVSIELPASIKKLGKLAFYECTALKNLYIRSLLSYLNAENGINYATPMYYAKNMYITGELRGIITVPWGVTEIPVNAFRECENLQYVYFENTVTKINSGAFLGCPNLKSVSIPDSVISIESYAFGQNPALVSVTLGKNLLSIGSYAFSECTSLTSITIPDSVRDMGDRVFASNSSLETVRLGKNLESMGTSVFMYCGKLESVNIPGALKRIPEHTFYRCYALNDLTISEGVEVIEKRAFDNCSRLTSITIPDSVKRIEEYAFAYCDLVTEIHLGSGLETVGEWAFYCGDQLSDVHIDTVKDWCEINFARTSNGIGTPMYIAENLYIDGVLAESVVIPEGITEIKRGTFSYILSIKDITIPSSVTSVGYCAFDFTENLSTVYYCGTQEQWQELCNNTAERNYKLLAAEVIFLEKGTAIKTFPKRLFTDNILYTVGVITEGEDYDASKVKAGININERNYWFENTPISDNRGTSYFIIALTGITENKNIKPESPSKAILEVNGTILEGKFVAVNSTSADN